MPSIFSKLLNRRLLIVLMGNLLVATWPLAYLVDLSVNLSFYAPNPYCDSPGLVLVGSIVLALIALPVVNAVTFVCTRHLPMDSDGTGASRKSWTKYVLAAMMFSVMTAPFVVEFSANLASMEPHKISADCGGTVESTTRIIRWQPSLVYEAWMLAWILFVGMLASCLIRSSSQCTTG